LTDCSLEYWAFELLVLIAGLLPNSTVSTSLIAMWYVCLF
jgi:multidrug resistance protein, MATE family